MDDDTQAINGKFNNVVRRLLPYCYLVNITYNFPNFWLAFYTSATESTTLSDKHSE